jgi:hypothetical protein
MARCNDKTAYGKQAFRSSEVSDALSEICSQMQSRENAEK